MRIIVEVIKVGPLSLNRLKDTWKRQHSFKEKGGIEGRIAGK